MAQFKRIAKLPKEKKAIVKELLDAFLLKNAVKEKLAFIEGLDKKAKTKLKDADLIQQFQAIEAMDEEDKNVVKKLIDAFITKKQLQKLVQ